MAITSAESGLVIAITMMFISFAFVIIPFVPAPLVMWGVAIGYAILDGFDRVTVLASILLTVLMVAGVTVDLWLRPLGMGDHGGCLTAIGSLIGGILGTFLIPIPILGSIIGAVLGAFFVQLLRRREWEEAVGAGGATLKMILVGKVIEFMICSVMFVVFLASVYFTR